MDSELRIIMRNRQWHYMIRTCLSEDDISSIEGVEKVTSIGQRDYVISLNPSVDIDAVWDKVERKGSWKNKIWKAWKKRFEGFLKSSRP